MLRQELIIEMPRIKPLTAAKIAIHEHSVLKIASTESDKLKVLCPFAFVIFLVARPIMLKIILKAKLNKQM